MSYQVIARKWRPQVFEEVIGQESVTQTLRNAITHERLHHAYIFSGARGVGKTTTARLLAKALNCHKTDKANPQPCDTNSDDACPSCIEISESRSLDVLEFDAASNTQVDKIREIIIENIQISSARDRYKIFIIDEVHMLSRSSFNALLKTLEEPPPNVVFVMATTELHKVPDTILSRVQEFEFRTIALQKILNRLKTISDTEQINISEPALKEIARSGEGSMRDAQSNFDQVISFSDDKIDTEDVIKALGIASAENLITTVLAISGKNKKNILVVVDDLIARGQDLRHFCTDLLSFFRDMLVYKTAGDAEKLLDNSILSADELKKYSEPFTEEDLIRFFNSIAETETSLREANEPRYLLEIGLIKLIEMQKVKGVEELLERLSNLELLLSDSETNPDSNNKTPAQNESSTPIEKKTLKPRISPDEVPFRTKSEAKSAKKTAVIRTSSEKFSSSKDSTDNSNSEVAEQNANSNFIEEPPDYIEGDDYPLEEPIPNISIENKDSDSSSILNLDSMPIKLEPFNSEELEHIEDKWLDQTFEYKLLHEGDNLKAILNAKTILEPLLLQIGGSNITDKIEQKNESIDSNRKNPYTKQNKALDIVNEMTSYEEIDETIPELPANPTDEEVFTYGKNHPSVKKAIRIFRGKLMKVGKKL